VTTLPEHDAYGTGRRSQLLPGFVLVHADLHNHTWLSDGAGDPAGAFAAMRRSGLDVAALTDHAKLDTRFTAMGGWPARRLLGLDQPAWQRVGELADAANQDGRFVAFRGFEWSHPTHGHVCVWDSDTLLSPFRSPRGGMDRLYDWLHSDPGAARALAGFNHPGGRRSRRFDGFTCRPAVTTRLVGLEMFNKTDDYLYAGVAAGQQSPLVACLEQGWRPGLVGVSDEHGPAWGTPQGKGRTGLYVRELSRAGVREALLARRSFASRVKGLRLAATAAGTPMGGTVHHRRGPLTIEIDVDLGRPSWGTALSVQLLRPGPSLPLLAAVHDVRVPSAGEPAVSFPVEVDVDDGRWAVVRVSDPGSPADAGTPQPYAELGRSLAYASPFWFQPHPM